MSISHRRAAVLLAALAPLIAQAENGGPSSGAPYSLVVKVGESAAVCKTGTILCPAAGAICDDTSIAVGETTGEGLVFKGLKPGATLCSARASSGQGMQTIYRVTVVP
jgi:hypothetical protein